MQESPFQRIVICGGGLAGVMCAAALSKALPSSIEITLVDSEGADGCDVFYGTVTTPSSYKFLLDIGIGEPHLLPRSNTSFSLGTQYKNWGAEGRSWTQSFHQPLPVLEGVEFHHYLTRIRSAAPQLAKLEPYIMSVQAAEKSVFAHPPQDQNIPLSDVEYGYHFLPSEWRRLIYAEVTSSAVRIIKANIESVAREGDDIRALNLSNETRLEADLFINCMGPTSVLSVPKEPGMGGARKLTATASFKPKPAMEGVCRALSGTDHGWISKTPLQDGEHTLTISHFSNDQSVPANNDKSKARPITATIGVSNQPWENNYLALGPSAAIIEPLTPAPILLLQRDIERLIELVPVGANMAVERREYNRRFKDDYEHITAFHRAFFEGPEPIETAYWRAATAEPISSKLENKITQFQSRGALAQYDLEPFGKEDWTQLHVGMGRMPQRYDKVADKVPIETLFQTLRNKINANKAMALRLPNHHDYITKLLEYFRKQA